MPSSQNVVVYRPATEYQINVSFESVRMTHALGLRRRWDDRFRMHGPE
jgi:hypothetical protein